MKQLLFIFAVTLASCNNEPPPSVAFASVVTPPHVERAANCNITNKAATATYFSPDVSFSLRFDQYAVIEMDGKTELVSADVFQIAPGVFVAQMPEGDFVRVNTVSGTTSAKIGGKAYNFSCNPTP